MNSKKILSWGAAVFVAIMTLDTSAQAATGTQVGDSGKTYASSGIQCALNPVKGMAPMVLAGLYNPKRNASATVSLTVTDITTGTTVTTNITTVNFISPDTNVWLDNGDNTVEVALNRGGTDSYTFDASSAQLNYCIPDTSENTSDGTWEYAVSGKSKATVAPGCALNPITGLAQPYVHLVDNGDYLLNVSVNNVPLTQLSTTRPHTPVFLSAGLNVISAANASLSTDYYVRNGGSGSCTLP